MNQEAILRLLNLQLQRQRCSRLECFWSKEKKFLKTHYANSNSVNFYSAGVENQDLRIGSWILGPPQRKFNTF
jgi:hypothetical protein